MASGAKRKTTMAKLNRERAVLEKRHKKAARKEARKREAAEAAESERGGYSSRDSDVPTSRATSNSGPGTTPSTTVAAAQTSATKVTSG